MSPSVPEFVKTGLSLAKIAPVPGLAPAIECLELCINLYEGLQTNQREYALLLNRAADLLVQVVDASQEVDYTGEPMIRWIIPLIQ